ncbi:MAG: glycosyltransferase domain-containing protein [Deltaproteobacteria bacterium]
MAAYAEYHAPIVWGAERNLFPDIGCDRDAVFPASPGGFRYLNSGVCVAQTDAMLEALRHIGAADIQDDHKSADGTHDVNPNDQEMWLKAFVELEEPKVVPHNFGLWDMALDIGCHIALNMHGVTPDDLDMSGERIRVKTTGAEPCVVHFNGASKTDGMLATVLAKLGY